MGIKNWQEITLDSETFDNARENFNLLLQRLFQKMEQNNSDEGTITLKVDISMIDDYITDEEGKTKRIVKPILKHKVSTAVPVKDSFDGKKDTGMEIVYDEELKRYVLKYVSQGGQRSIFDPDYEDIVNGTAKEVEDVPVMIEERKLLTGCVEEVENSDSSAVATNYEENNVEQENNSAGGYTEATDSVEDDYEYE